MSEHVTYVESLVIDLDQLGRAAQTTLEFPSTGLTLSAGGGRWVPAVTINPSLKFFSRKIPSCSFGFKRLG